MEFVSDVDKQKSKQLADLEKAKHTIDLPKRDFMTVNIDYGQMGVGGDNSWEPRTHKEFQLSEKVYKYSYVLKLK